MGFVFYDLETTGIDKRHDQILQFAAIRTDVDLNVEERVELGCRLDPHVVPHPEAMLITRRGLRDMQSQDHPSHYAMMCEIARLFEGWAPATLVGFNSIQFDEKMLWHGFYRTLHDPYLTSRGGNVRADALTLCRAVAFYSPGALQIPYDEAGIPRFRLGMLHVANGGVTFEAHNAMADADATLALCRLVRSRDEESWSRFLRFSGKAAVGALVDSSDPFGIVRFRGNTPCPAPAVVFARVEGDANLRLALDLSCDLDGLAGMSDADLAALLSTPESPVLELRINACPAVCEIWDLPASARPGLDDDACEAGAKRVAEDPRLGERLGQLAARPDYPKSPHVEEQLFDSLPLDADLATFRRFHAAPWEARGAILAQVQDPRFRRLGQRLQFLEAPHTLPEGRRGRLELESRKRLRRSETPVPWRTIEDALEAIERLGDACPAEMRAEFEAWEKAIPKC